MAKLLSKSRAVLGSLTPVIELTTTGTANWPAWDRFLAVNGGPVVHIGNICGTCSFFFERLDSTARPPIDVMRAELAKGFAEIDPVLVESFGALLSKGEYLLALIDCVPVRVEQGTDDDYFVADKQDAYDDPMEPNTHYYRLKDRSSIDLGKDRYDDPVLGFEFIVPLGQPIDPATLSAYRARLIAGERPTAVSLSVLDIKQPYDGHAHWCMAHYLLDGHHKVEAAARAGKPITVLAFIPVEGGISREEHIADFLSSYPQTTPPAFSP